MKLWRKCALLCLLALLAMTAGAAACEGGECLHHWELDCIGEEPVEDVVSLQGAGLEAVEKAIIEGIRTMQSSISIREYQVPIDDFLVLMGHVGSNNPDLFMARGCGYGYSSDGTVTTVYPKYTMTSEEYPAAKAVYDEGVSAIVEQVDPDWSDEEKLLQIHDYIATHFEYDMRAYDPEQINNANYDAYRFFRDGTGVCQAYAMTFMAAARELALEVSYVESNEMVHIWNLVKVDGSWYHVDVTWDDPVEDRLGYAKHNHFLTSDVQSAAAHRDDASDWLYGNGEACTDTTYDNYCWRSAVSPFLYVDGVWYAVTEEGLKTWDGASPDFEETVDGFASPSSGLSLHCGRLYYNGYYEVRCYEPFTGRIFLVRDFARAHGAGHYGQGLAVEGDTLTYEVYWFDEDDVYHYGRGNCPLESYLKAAEDGSFGYYVSNGRLYLQADTDQVAVAFYNDKGRMTGVSLLTGESSCALRKGQVKLIAMTANGWLPCEKTLDGTVL